MSKVTARIKEEFKEHLPPTILFFVALHLLAMIGHKGRPTRQSERPLRSA